MLNFLPGPLLGVIAFLLLVLNVLFWVPVLLLFAVVRLILPFKRVRLIIDPLLVRIAEAWISGNSGWMTLTQRTDWDVEGSAGLPVGTTTAVTPSPKSPCGRPITADSTTPGSASISVSTSLG